MRLFTSQISKSPARLPKPQRASNRPEGDHDIVFLCDSPNRKRGSAVLPLKRQVWEGIEPDITMKTLVVGEGDQETD